MAIGLPKINIIFKELASSAIQRGERGIVLLLLKDTGATGTHAITNMTEIPTALTEENKTQCRLALMGGVQAPLRIIAHVVASDTENWLTVALKKAETLKFDYVVVPEIATGEDATIKSWVLNQRSLGKKVKAVLPNYTGDHEAIIDFAANEIQVGETTNTTAQYCSRIAGLIVGTPLYMSTTFQPLNEIDSVGSMTKTELDAAINLGKFVLFHDGEKVKVARGVNSFQTATAEKGDSFKKIKIVDTMDLIENDIVKTISDNYIGKYPNTYDNKVLLITAIQAYYTQLEREQLLDTGKNTIGIDINAQRAYLKSKGVQVETMTDQQIKEANTQDKVFLSSSIKIVDAIEDVDLGISL